MGHQQSDFRNDTNDPQPSESDIGTHTRSESDIGIHTHTDSDTVNDTTSMEDESKVTMEDVGSDYSDTEEVKEGQHFDCHHCIISFLTKEELERHVKNDHFLVPAEMTDNEKHCDNISNSPTNSHSKMSPVIDVNDMCDESNAKDSTNASVSVLSEDSNESVMIDLTSTQEEQFADVSDNENVSGTDGDKERLTDDDSVNDPTENINNGHNVSQDSVPIDTSHNDDCLQKLRDFLKLKYIEITLNSISENACGIFCRQYVRDAREYKEVLTDFLVSNEQSMDILNKKYVMYVRAWSGEGLQPREIAVSYTHLTLPTKA